MTNLYSQLGYSTEMLQALGLIVPVVFGAGIKHLRPICYYTFWKLNFKRKSMCKFDMVEISFFLIFQLYLYIFVIYVNT